VIADRPLAAVCAQRGHRGHLNPGGRVECVVCSVALCGELAPGHDHARCALPPDHEGEHVADWSPVLRWGA
jgi:hypothetical protein